MAMTLAVLAVCPCPTVMAAPASEESHGCCAGKAGLNVAPSASSCCSDEARDPRLAMASVPVALVAGWATLDTVIVTLPAPSLLSSAIAAAPPSKAPPVLRI